VLPSRANGELVVLEETQGGMHLLHLHLQADQEEAAAIGEHVLALCLQLVVGQLIANAVNAVNEKIEELSRGSQVDELPLRLGVGAVLGVGGKGIGSEIRTGTEVIGIDVHHRDRDRRHLGHVPVVVHHLAAPIRLCPAGGADDKHNVMFFSDYFIHLHSAAREQNERMIIDK
jgi:hypothetical protein